MRTRSSPLGVARPRPCTRCARPSRRGRQTLNFEAHSRLEKEALTKKFIDQFVEQCKQEHDMVIDLGGLYVIGTERHESRRIDNQLRGRQGRQGDPGASRFYVALEYAAPMLCLLRWRNIHHG